MSDPQVSFIAMARATTTNIRQWQAIPEADFQPYNPEGKDQSHLWIALAHTHVTDCDQPIPSVVIRDDTQNTSQKWRVVFFKNLDDQTAKPEAIDAEYRQRQEQELGFRQFVHHLTGHCLPKAYQMIRELNSKGQKRKTVATEENPESQPGLLLVAWIKFLTFNLIHNFGKALGAKQGRCEAATLVRRYIFRPGRLFLKGNCLLVQLDPFHGSEDLKDYLEQINKSSMAIPWLPGFTLQIQVAEKVQGLAMKPKQLKQLFFANSTTART
jgi:hypothetical protein